MNKFCIFVLIFELDESCFFLLCKMEEKLRGLKIFFYSKFICLLFKFLVVLVNWILWFKRKEYFLGYGVFVLNFFGFLFGGFCCGVNVVLFFLFKLFVFVEVFLVNFGEVFIFWVFEGSFLVFVGIFMFVLVVWNLLICCD